jgi:uncharacterized membrane protein HdeD (DUF308 family)
MKQYKVNIKFEYVLIVLILAILAGVLFFNTELTDSAQMALLAITSLLSGVTGYLWGITQVDTKQNNP